VAEVGYGRGLASVGAEVQGGLTPDRGWGQTPVTAEVEEGLSL